MQVDRVSITNSIYNKPQSLNFEGRLLDNKIVKQVVESSALENRKSTFYQKLSRIKNDIFGTERAFYLDGKGGMTNPDLFEYDSYERKYISRMPKNLLRYPEMRTIFRFTKNENGIQSVERMRFDKKNRLKIHQFISPYNDSEIRIYRKYSPEGNEISYTVISRDINTGKLLGRTTYDSIDGNVLVHTDKNGKLRSYAEKGEVATLLHDNGELNGRIIDDDSIYHFEKENYSFSHRYKLNLADCKYKLTAFLKALIPTENQKHVVCYRFDKDYKYIGKTPLARNVSIENALWLRRSGALRKFSYSKD